MVDVPQPDEGFDAEEITALRQAAESRRADGDVTLADVLDHYAEHGLPDVSECTPWEEVRDAHYRSLGVNVAGSRVA
jgi:hypothetical protein